MRYFLNRLKRIAKPLAIAYLITAIPLTMLVLNERLIDDADVIAALVPLAICFAVSCVACAIYDHSEYVKHSLDCNLIEKSFGGFSPKSRAFHSAVTELRRGNLQQALEMFGDITEYKLEEREEALVCFYKAECYRFMGYNTNAAISYVKAIEQELNEGFIYVLAARCYTNAGTFSQAMELYKTAESQGYMYDSIYTDMGMCCLKAEKPDEALEYFARSLREGLNVPFATGGCAIAYIMKKDVEKSREFYCKALLSGMSDIKGFIHFYRAAAEAAECTEKIAEFSKLSIDSNDVTE